MSVQVYVADLYGRVLAELTVNIGPVSWQLNKTGKAVITLAKSDPKYTPDIVKLGNRVLIRFDNGLPDWGGTIEMPWTETPGTMEMTCLSIENTLAYRTTKKNRWFYHASVGAIFTAVINEAQTFQSLGINLGHIWNGGGSHSPQYHFKKLLDLLQKSICAMEPCDFSFTPLLASGYLSFIGELWLQRGQDKTSSVVLLEGVNVSDPVMKWQGPVVNHFAAIGNGSTWGDERQTSIQEDVASIASWGLREDSGSYTGVTYSTTLDAYAATKVKQQAWPSRKVSLSAANLAPALFADYDVGDWVRLILPSFTYDHSVRLLGREFDPMTGDCVVILEEATVVEPTYAGTDEVQ